MAAAAAAAVWQVSSQRTPPVPARQVTSDVPVGKAWSCIEKRRQWSLGDDTELLRESVSVEMMEYSEKHKLLSIKNIF